MDVFATKDHGNAEARLNTLCCPSELNWVNRKDAKGAKGFIYFLIGTDDQEKNHALLVGYLLRLFTMRFIPSFINGTFQFRRNPSLRLVSLR